MVTVRTNRFVECNPLREEQLLQPLLLIQRSLHAQIRRPRYNAFCEGQDAFYVEFSCTRSILHIPRLEPRRLALIGALDLDVVFQLALAFEPGVDRLTRIPIAVSIRFPHTPAADGQHHRLFTIA